MNLKGKVSSIENGVRVVFPNNNISYVVKAATHIGNLTIGDNVAVMFFSNNMIDGLVIAKFE